MRLIDADYADQLAKDLFKGQIGITFYQAVHAMLESIPTIDAEPVIRCEECLYNRSINCDAFPCHLTGAYPMHSNDFCSYGERKDGEK